MNEVKIVICQEFTYLLYVWKIPAHIHSLHILKDDFLAAFDSGKDIDPPILYFLFSQ